jgi:threonine dehydrogenase-like Zn-dependent dehydrogenase
MAEYVLMPADGVAQGCLFEAERDLPSERLALTEPLSACVAGQRSKEPMHKTTRHVVGSGSSTRVEA